MELFERRRYYFCSFCGTFHFIETPAEDGIRVLAEPSARACPLCRAPLVKALLDDDYSVEHCEQCRGVLIARTPFAEAIGRRRSRESGPPAPPVPIDDRELKRRLLCPSCRAEMLVHPYYGPGNVIIDSCSRCDLIWLDYGELKQITDAPGRDRGRKPPVDISEGDSSVRISSSLAMPRRITLFDLFDAIGDPDVWP